MEMRRHIKEARTAEGKYDPEAELDPLERAKAILKLEKAPTFPTIKIEDEFSLPYGFGDEWAMGLPPSLTHSHAASGLMLGASLDRPQREWVAKQAGMDAEWRASSRASDSSSRRALAAVFQPTPNAADRSIFVKARPTPAPPNRRSTAANGVPWLRGAAQ